MHIKISNELWATMLHRKDIKSPVWFGFPNAWIESDDFFNFTGDEFKALIYIMSLASKKVSQVIFLQPDRADRIAKIPQDAFWSLVRKMIGLCHFAEHDPNTAENNPYGSRTDETQIPPDHEKIPTATGQNRTGQDTTGQDSRQDSTSPPASAVLDSLSGSEAVNGVLIHVPLSVQKLWVSEYQDTKWIKEVLAKAVLKKLSGKRKVAASDWAFVLTTWLISEKDRPRISKPSAGTVPEPQISREEADASVQALLSKLNVNSLSEAIWGEKAKDGHHVQ